MSNLEDENVKTWTAFYKTDDKIGMLVGTRDGDNYIKAGQIGLAINETGEPGSYESTAYINADHVNIGANDSIHALIGSLKYDPVTDSLVFDEPTGGLVVEKTKQGVTAQFGIWDKDNLTGGVMVQQINGQTGTVTYLKGDIIVIGNSSTIDPAYGGKTLNGTLTEITTDFTSVNTLLAKKIEATDINATTVQAAINQSNLLNVHQLSASSAIGCTGPVSCQSLWVAGSSASWKYFTNYTYSLSGAYYFVDYLGTQVYGRLVTGSSHETIHYIGWEEGDD